jgi:hypothetical protein
LYEFFINILFSLRERMSEGQVRVRVILKNKIVQYGKVIILSKALSLIRPTATFSLRAKGSEIKFSNLR